MRPEEKRRKFNEDVINTLYPPPSPPPKHDVDVAPNILSQDFELHELGSRGSGSSTTNGDEDGNDDSETQKLTRAQRKRLRKRKLKEDISRRKQLIGPLLPSSIDQGQDGPHGVRPNASDEEPAGDREHHPAGCSNRKNKVRQRRKAKKLARESEQH